jgi:hypothetical protein
MDTVGTIFETKENSMNWLKRWLARAVVEGHEDSDRADRVYATAVSKLSLEETLKAMTDSTSQYARPLVAGL